MEKKIKVIIADDNKGFCRILEKYLLEFEEIELLGTAHNDEEEIEMIENLKPEIVITDLVRKHEYTGLQIIKDYSKRKVKPEFLVISADQRVNVIDDNLKIGGYIQKPFCNYSIVIEKIREIHTNILINKQNRLIMQEQAKFIRLEFWNKILEFLKIRKR